MDKLEEIIKTKHQPLPSFKQAIERRGVIAEMKRKSPSAGNIADFDPVTQSRKYAGCAAYSILTDKDYFSGDIDDINLVRDMVPVPILRKDFIVHPEQLTEVRSSAVLLIVAALKDRLREMLALVEALGMDALVEVHNREELNLALDAGAKIIGVNNRNLKTLEVDVETSLELIDLMPDHVLKVAESGIADVATARKLFDAGYHALLVGEALMKNTHPNRLIERMKRRVKICGIKDPDLAFKAAEMGVDFVGIVFDPESKRFVSMETAKKIAVQAKKGGARVVGVFRYHEEEDISSICHEVGIDIAQLHGDLARGAHDTLSDDIPRIFVVDGSIPDDLNRHRDYIMYDAPEPGKGHGWDWSQAKALSDFPMFVAGGISPKNVKEVIKVCDPDVIDISTGVEKNGEKDLTLIRELLEQC